MFSPCLAAYGLYNCFSYGVVLDELSVFHNVLIRFAFFLSTKAKDRLDGHVGAIFSVCLILFCVFLVFFVLAIVMLLVIFIRVN